MRHLGRDWPRVAAQMRSLLDRSALGLLIGLAIVLMLLGKADMKLANYLVERVGDAAVPVLRVLGEPVTGLRAGIDRVAGLLAVYEENERLREENRRLLAWQGEAARLTVQNRSLRTMVNLPPEARVGSWITARVVADVDPDAVVTMRVERIVELSRWPREIRAHRAATTARPLVRQTRSASRRSAQRRTKCSRQCPLSGHSKAIRAMARPLLIGNRSRRTAR